MRCRASPGKPEWRARLATPSFPSSRPWTSFKLNGYQIDNLAAGQGITSSKEYELLLNRVPPLSIMFQTSLHQTSAAAARFCGPRRQCAVDGQLLFPQQASSAACGRIAPGLGAFIQIT
jgi:hypothetical protein